MSGTKGIGSGGRPTGKSPLTRKAGISRTAGARVTSDGGITKPLSGSDSSLDSSEGLIHHLRAVIEQGLPNAHINLAQAGVPQFSLDASTKNCRNNIKKKGERASLQGRRTSVTRDYAPKIV